MHARVLFFSEICAYVYLSFCDALCCCDFVNSALAVGIIMSSSVAPDGLVS